MKALDIVILVAVALAAWGAIRYTRRHKGGCCGDCSRCGTCAGCTRPEKRDPSKP